MIQDIATSIGVFDVSDEDYLFMKEFVANAVYDDYDHLVQLCDALAMPTGFCLLEKRFVDVTIRYGVHTATNRQVEKDYETSNGFFGNCRQLYVKADCPHKGINKGILFF